MEEKIMNSNRSKSIACVLIVFVVLMVALPLVLAVRVKKFDDLVKEKTEIIKTLQDENKKLKENAESSNNKISDYEKQVQKLNRQYSNLMKDYKNLEKKLEVPEEEEDKVTVEKVTESDLHAQKPETTETKQTVTTEKKEEVTTEQETTEKKTEAPTEKEETDSGLRYSEEYPKSSGHLTRSNGSIRYNGHRETWYSTNEGCGQTTAVSIPGKHVADDGTIRDKDGYICVASSDYSFYTVVQTSVGPGKVYDCGCSHGTIDVYTSW